MCHNPPFLTLPCTLLLLSLSLALPVGCGGSEGTTTKNNMSTGTNTTVSMTGSGDTTVVVSTGTSATTAMGTTGTVGSTGGATATGTGSPSAEGVAQSVTGRVKFKGGSRWGAELSRALELPVDELCKEFGAYSCVGLVHKIALGGMEPYKLAVVEPTEVAPVTAPLAVDRVALSACVKRFALDKESGNPVIFGTLKGGKPSKEEVAGVVDSLYQRLLARNPSPQEREVLSQALDGFPSAEEWAISSCFALASSVEMLFY